MTKSSFSHADASNRTEQTAADRLRSLQRTSHDAADLAREYLESTPTIFGRLVLAAGMLDRSTGEYSNHELERQCCNRRLSCEFKRIHEEVLLQWLNSSLETRVRDLVCYFRAMRNEGVMAAGRMIHTRGYTDLLPLNTNPAHRDHFLMDATLVLSLSYVQL